MTDPPPAPRARRRTYYLLGGAALALLVGGLLAMAVTRAAPARAQVVDISAEPSMTKGPAGAQVTILEFSDYQ